MTTRVLIVGASLAGLRTAENLRARGFTGEIVISGTEQHAPYNRPPLSKDVLRGEADLDSLTFRPSRALDPVVWHLGRAAVACDMRARTVSYDDGSSLAYDVLVVATGVRPRQVIAPRGDSVVSLRTVDDARRLAQHLSSGCELLIVGGGFVGCEVAASARKVGVDVTVVTKGAAAPLADAIGEDLAGILFQRHLAEGVVFHLDDSVAEIAPRGSEVVLESGARCRADIVLEAVGSVPNTEWLAGNGLDLTDGVLCDDRMAAVGIDAVFAVGDVARFPNVRFDHVPRRVEHWNVAVETARRAATAISSEAGGNGPVQTAFRPMPTFWSNQYDIRLQAYGMTRLADRVVPFDETMGGGPIMGYYRGDDLVAVAALTNGPRLVELSTGIGAAAAVA